MAGTDYVSRSELDAFLREAREMLHGYNLGNSTIDRGALRVVSAEGLIVEGSQRVSGTLIVSGEETVDGILTVTGTLIVSGEANVTGSTEFTGDTTFTGTTDITGPTMITGTFGIDGDTTITGDVTLTGNFTVTGAGKIKVGSVELSAGIGGSGGLTAPVQIVMVTPLVDVQGALAVAQALVADGAVTFSSLFGVPPGMTTVPLVINPSTGRVYLG
jgi:predicted acyltransferase (DUF342 family)